MNNKIKLIDMVAERERQRERGREREREGERGGERERIIAQSS